jgi:hypothetical protein
MKESGIHNEQVFISDDQPSEAVEPGKGAFNNESSFVSSQLAPILSREFLSVFPMWSNQVNPVIQKSLSQRVAVRGAIINKTFHPGGFPFEGNGVQRFLDELDFVYRGRRQECSERNTRAVDHHHPLCALPPLGGTNSRAPFLAEAKLPSMKHSLHSSSPLLSSSSRNAPQMTSHTPSSSQIFSRRQQVLGLGYRLGRSLHRAPVFRTHRIPSSTSLLPAQGRPPLSLLGISGNRGSNFSHCASVSSFSFRAIGITSGPYIVHNISLMSSPFYWVMKPVLITFFIAGRN